MGYVAPILGNKIVTYSEKTVNAVMLKNLGKGKIKYFTSRIAVKEGAKTNKPNASAYMGTVVIRFVQ